MSRIPRIVILSFLLWSTLMTGSFYFIKPEAATNLVTNPSAELATTGYTAVGGSIARSTANQRHGVSSIAVTPTSGTGDGVYYGTVSLTNGQSYTFSVDVLGANGVPYRIYVGSTGGSVLGTPTTFTGTGKWQRVEVTYTETSTTTRRLYVVKNTSSSTAVFYVDGFQCENAAYSTTYIDGDQPGCKWTGIAHNSTSSRSSQSRSGGKKIDLQSYNGFLSTQQGTGMPPIRNSTQPYGSAPGSFYQNSVAAERPFTLTFSVTGDGVADWHSKRASIIDLIKPDLTSTNLPMVIGYTDAGGEIEISCVYDGGLEVNDGATDIELIALKFLAPDPYWYRVGSHGATLSVPTEFSMQNILKRDSDGLWSSISGNITAATAINVIAVSPYTGYVYVGGSFTSIGGVSNTSRVAYYDGTSWNAMGTGANGTVWAFAFDPDGTTVYMGGDFTLAGGVANTARIAKWNGSAWVAMGTGASTNGVSSIAIGFDGKVYVGGNFGALGGVANTLRVGYWNGSAWNAMGTGANASVEALVVGLDGSIYAGGSFSLAGGVANTAGIAKWNGSAWSALGTGVGSGVLALAVGLDGTIYVGGSITSAGGVTVNNIAKWNGITWSTVGAGIDGGAFEIFELSIDPTTGFLYAVTAGGVSAGVALGNDTGVFWNGAIWLGLDYDMPGHVNSLGIGLDGVLWMSSTTDTATSGVNARRPTTTTIVNNSSANSYPKVIFYGPTTNSNGISKTWSLHNATTEDHIYFNNLTLLPGEVLTLDLTPGQKTFTSNFRGNMMNYIRPGSNVATWRLQPGTNSVYYYDGYGGSTAAGFDLTNVVLWWRERCWSIDNGIATS